MNIYKNKFMSRFGLMHMIATNICNWLKVLILETSHEIKHMAHGENYTFISIRNDHNDINNYTNDHHLHDGKKNITQYKHLYGILFLNNK